jgi:hypothetical protein
MKCRRLLQIATILLAARPAAGQFVDEFREPSLTHRVIVW